VTAGANGRRLLVKQWVALASSAFISCMACGAASGARGGAETVMPSKAASPVAADEGLAPMAVAVSIDPARIEVGLLPERGVLVVSWLEQAAAEEFRRNGQLPPASIVPFVARSRVAEMDRGKLITAEGVLVQLSGPAKPEPVVPIALFDGAHAFWPAVMGAPVRTLIGFGTARPGGDMRVALEPNPSKDSHGARFGCAGERFQSLDVDGDDATPARKACVYLPASYGREPGRRYPVVYLLPGLGGNETVRFTDPQLLAHADELAERQQEAILVGVDTRSPHGLTRTVAAVDGRLRTIAHAPARALLGQSTGGFNAISAVLLAPDVFGAVGASAPDGLDLEAWLLEPSGKLRPQWLAWMRLEAAVGGVGQMLSYAESWAPSGASEESWPADLDTGEIRRDVLEAWLRHSPARMVGTPEGKRALASASGRILISVSRDDEFGLFEPARRFSEELQRLGILHDFVAGEGGHFDVRGRLSDLLGRLLGVLPPARG
jgi:hypothetical protein